MNAGKCLGMGGLAVERSAERGAIRAKIGAQIKTALSPVASTTGVVSGPRRRNVEGDVD